ncbi:MAG TPA: OB-fold nucleic acid binding domain-containing protein [Chthoniobacterales bacterium]
MKTLLFLLLLAIPCFADISPDEASKHVGEHSTVTGVISQITTTAKGTTFINFGGRYPNHVFTAVIFRKDRDMFDSLPAEGAVISVSGNIALYKGKPEIILTHQEQIQNRSN